MSPQVLPYSGHPDSVRQNNPTPTPAPSSSVFMCPEVGSSGRCGAGSFGGRSSGWNWLCRASAHRGTSDRRLHVRTHFRTTARVRHTRTQPTMTSAFMRAEVAGLLYREQSVMTVKPAVRVLQVLTDGTNADPADSSDLLSSQPLSQERDHVEFPVRESDSLSCVVSVAALRPRWCIDGV